MMLGGVIGTERGTHVAFTLTLTSGPVVHVGEREPFRAEKRARGVVVWLRGERIEVMESTNEIAKRAWPR